MASIAIMIGGAIINEENRIKLLDWISTNDRIKDEAKQNFTNTDYALKLYNKVRRDERIDLKQPQFSKFYKPSSAQKQGLGNNLRWSISLGNRIGSKSFLVIKMLNKKLSNVYYSPKGFWKGLSAVKKLSKESGVSEDISKLWLMKQAIWQIYLPAPKAPKNIPRPTFDVHSPKLIFFSFRMTRKEERFTNMH